MLFPVCSYSQSSLSCFVSQILNHPGIPQLRREDSKNGRRGSIVDIPDDCSSDENIDSNMVVGGNC